jgi:hypothetical protein
LGLEREVTADEHEASGHQYGGRNPTRDAAHEKPPFDESLYQRR